LHPHGGGKLGRWWSPTVQRIAATAALVTVSTALMALSILSLMTWRTDVVRWLPQTAALYSAIGLPVNLRGLVFADIKTETGTRDGMEILVVHGTVVSTSAGPVEVPRLRFAIRTHAGEEIYTWTTLPPTNVLAAGEAAPFRSQLDAPPPGGDQVLVRFINNYDHPDILAGIRQ
jgi:hypothetical protein